MSEGHRKAMAAAVALSKALSLPSGKGTVFAWHDNHGDRLIVSADSKWILAHRTVPPSFQGYPVVIEEALNAVAHAIR